MSLFGTLTAIGGAIASAASAIGAPVAGLASAMGASTATAGTIGSVAGSAALGSASGAALTAATGGDPGQGALLGALTGGATAGLGALGGAAAPAGGITGQAGQAATAAQPAVSEITKGVATPAFQQAAGGIPGAAQVAAAEPSVSAITQGVATPAFQQASQTAAANAAGSGGIGSLLSNNTVKGVGMDLAKEGIGTGMDNMQQAQRSEEGRKLAQQASMDFQAERDQQSADIRNKVGKTFSGMNFAQGGEVGLKEGQFIIPADVVSALGNGSTKAGANFLDEFFGV
jgi:hypothetical protein